MRSKRPPTRSRLRRLSRSPLDDQRTNAREESIMTTASISIETLQQLLVRGEGVARGPTIIDVRTPGEFARLHARGAESMPLDQLDPAAVRARRQTADEPVYVICQSGGRATRACQQLNDAGAGPAVCIEGGTAAWQRAGLPVERTAGGVISLERQVRIAAGSLVLIGVLAAWLVHPLFLALAAFIGCGLVFAGITDFCGMGLLLAKMPWNRRGAGANQTCGS
jgi:rhodanese-related sulfurtransferase